MAKIEDKICEAIELIVSKSIAEAGYDRTIQAIIKKCEDPSIGKYKVAYQDTQFYAYSTNADIAYSNDTGVYVLIPANDMTKDKTILGTVEKMGSNYGAIEDPSNSYEYIGNNCIAYQGEIGLSSYRKPNSPAANPTTYVKTIYPSADGSVKIDTESMRKYIRESSVVEMGAVFRTDLKPEQQKKGNYGIIFGLKFLDNINGGEVTRYYTIDIDNMIGNPYQMALGKKQTNVFDIDNENFIEVESITVFTKDFEHTLEEHELIEDIFISDIQIYGVNMLSSEELSGCSITFNTPKGTIFKEGCSDDEMLAIYANVKIKGKKVNSVVQGIPIYWFKEDILVTTKSPTYVKYGGKGWRCLNTGSFVEGGIVNEHGIILASGGIENGILYQYYIENGVEKQREITDGKLSDDALIEWNSSVDNITIKAKEATSEKTRIKCVVVYNEIVYSKTIEITNLNRMPVIEIESSKGTQFYYDIGRTNLTCNVKIWNAENNKYIDLDPAGLTYVWGVEDSSGNLIGLPQDSEKNEKDYNNYLSSIAQLTQLENDIKNGIKFENAESVNLSQLQKEVDSYKNTQIVHSNQILNVQIKEIANFALYKCSVYNGNIFLGTANIKLVNSLNNNSGYTLIINNGSNVYQYDEYGVSPASPSLEIPVEVKPLTFLIFDNLGNVLENEVLNECEVVWKVPIKDTFFEDIRHDGTSTAMDATLTYQSIRNASFVSYNIKNKYNYNYVNNDIELSVTYKGLTLVAKTALSFVKQGQNGTNGTDYTCKIVPNTTQNNIPKYPTFTMLRNASNGYMNYNYPNSSQPFYIGAGESLYAPFLVKVYKSGEEVYSGNESGNTIPNDSGESTHIDIQWSILENTYVKSGSTTIKDYSDLTINEINGKIRYTGEGVRRGVPSANIIKCTVYYGDKTSGMGNRYAISATMPLIIARVTDTKYHINLKEDSGFRYVEYSTSGVVPKFDDSKPFEVEVTEKINGIDEVVSMIPGSHGISSFSWGARGNKLNNSNNGTVNQTDLIHLNSQVYLSKLKANQRNFKPATNYDGLCVSNAVVCSCSAGEIHIPIHFYLNKYGLADMNDWDGNAIQIREEGGTILSPKMIAGKKENDNSFTGVVMGEAKEYNRNTSDIGLMGYKSGNRTFTIDAETGAASFGRAGKIIVDPSTNKSLLYSSNFWSNYTEKGLPSSYDNWNRANQGMMIDLSSGEIAYGNGKFRVDSQGNLTANSGNIGGWTVSANMLHYQNGNTGLSGVTNAKVLDNRSIAFWANKDKFYVSHDGYLRAQEGKIGSGSEGIYLGKSSGDGHRSALYSGNKSYINNSTTGFYLGTDGLGIGPAHDIIENANEGSKRVSTFQVNQDGSFYAKKGYIGSSNTGWKINDSYLQNGNTIFGSTGLNINNKFSVSSSGSMTATAGTIANWTISANSIRTSSSDWNGTLGSGNNITTGMYFGTNGLRLGSGFGVTKDGKLIAVSGTIGGWTIGANSLSSTKNRIVLKSDGSINKKGDKWYITSGGEAHFSSCYISGGKLTLGGTTMSSAGGGSTTLPSGVKIATSGGGSAGLVGYIESLVLKNLSVEGTLIYKSSEVYWAYAVTSIQEATVDLTRKKITIKCNTRPFLGRKKPATSSLTCPGNVIGTL